jgi:Skp family chaperone for outer membrane proteins
LNRFISIFFKLKKKATSKKGMKGCILRWTSISCGVTFIIFLVCALSLYFSNPYTEQADATVISAPQCVYQGALTLFSCVVQVSFVDSAGTSHNETMTTVIYGVPLAGDQWSIHYEPGNYAAICRDADIHTCVQYQIGGIICFAFAALSLVIVLTALELMVIRARRRRAESAERERRRAEVENRKDIVEEEFDRRWAELESRKDKAKEDEEKEDGEKEDEEKEDGEKEDETTDDKRTAETEERVSAPPRKKKRSANVAKRARKPRRPPLSPPPPSPSSDSQVEQV